MSHEHDYYWYNANNEEGWKCCACDDKPGEPPGFSPQLDREQIFLKVWCILHDLHEHKFLYVSNGTGGDALAENIAARCKREDIYDQETIALWLLESSQKSHAEYWKNVSDGIIAGNDPRDRCACGRLSTSSRWIDGRWKYECGACWEVSLEGKPF